MKEALLLFFLSLIWGGVFMLAARYVHVNIERRIIVIALAVFSSGQFLPEIVAHCDLRYTKFVMNANMSNTTSLWLLSVFALIPVVFLCVSLLYLLGIMLSRSKAGLPSKPSEKKIHPGIIALLIAFVVVLTLIVIFFLVHVSIPLISAHPSVQGKELAVAPPSHVKFQTARAKLAVFWLDIGGIHPTSTTKALENGVLGLSVILTVVGMLLTYLFWWILVQERLVKHMAEKRWIGMLLGLSGFLIFSGVAYDAFATITLLVAVAIPMYLLLCQYSTKWLIRILFLTPFAINACWEAVAVLCLPIDACVKIIGLK